MLFEGREAQAGAMFADADLMGVPLRLIVSEKNIANGQVEWKRRATGKKGLMPVGETAATAKEWVRGAIEEIGA